MSHNLIAQSEQPLGHPSRSVSPNSGSKWYLVGKIDRETAQRTIRINATPFHVGRCEELSLTIPDPTVSAVHAEILVDGDSLTVRDLASTNGTFVNGNRVLGEVELFENDVIQFADVALRLCRDMDTIDVRRTTTADASGHATALIHFDQLLDGQEAVVYFQPIVSLDNQHVIGYEALTRSRLPGLKTPQEMFAVAEHLDLEVELSRCLRQKSVAFTRILHQEINLFVNTHPTELEASGLTLSLRQMRSLAGDRRLTLEIHEAAMTNVIAVRELRATLSGLNIQLAYDDFGAGQPRLLELAEVPPDYLKFDIQLIRGIHAATAHRQRMLATLVRMASELGVVPVAEGIETEADGVACKQLGFVLAQGYLYGRPKPARTFLDA